MPKFKLSALIVFVCIFVTSPSYAKRSLMIPGTGDSQELLRAVASEFNSIQKEVFVIIPDSVGSGGGVKMVGRGEYEIGRVARGIKDKEKRYNLKYMQFAASPIVFAVNANISAIDNITQEQVLGVYSGSISDWSVLGAPPGRIYVISREPGDSSRKVIEKGLPGFKEIKEMAGITLFSTPEASKMLGQYKNSIAYLPYSMTVGKLVKIFKYEGLKYNHNLYPFVTPLGFVWKGEMSEDASLFLDFMYSKQGQKILVDFGVVPISR